MPLAQPPLAILPPAVWTPDTGPLCGPGGTQRPIGKGGGCSQARSLGPRRPLGCFSVQLSQTDVKLKSSKIEAGKLNLLLILVTWVTFVTHISYHPANSYCPQNSVRSGGRKRGKDKDRGVGARVGGQMTFPLPPENFAGSIARQEKSSQRRVAVEAPRTSVPAGCGETTSGHFCACLPPWQPAYCVQGQGAFYGL